MRDLRFSRTLRAAACAPAVVVAALALLAAPLGACGAPPSQTESLSALLDQGDAALGAGDLGKAADLFSRVASAEPGNARAVFGLGLARLRQGRAADALALFEKASTLDPANPHPLYLRAHTLARLGRRDEAIQAYRTLIESHPSQYLATLEMLGQMVDANRLDDARRSALDALNRWPSQFGLLLETGRILGLKGDHAASIDYYRRAREIRPYAKEPVYGLVEAYRRTGRVKESLDLIKEYEQLAAREHEVDAMRDAASKTPDDPAPMRAWVERLFAEGRLEEGVAQSQTLLARFPSLPDRAAVALRAAQAALAIDAPDTARDLLHAAESVEKRPVAEMMQMARIHEGLGEWREALEVYDRCLQERPDDATALLGMGRASMRTGQLDLAESPLRRAIALKPDDQAARASLGLLLIKKGENDKGLAELNAVLKKEPDQPDALFGLGFLAHQRGDRDEAETYLRKALAARPADGSASVVLAIVLSEKGRCEEAIPIFTQALESDYRNLALHAGLVRCLEQTGRTAEAAEQRRIAEELAGRSQ